ncbi:hypothetical protein GGR73_002835 [Xanthomonas sp. F14]
MCESRADAECRNRGSLGERHRDQLILTAHAVPRYGKHATPTNISVSFSAA